ncbi:MAG: c-type cytochrome [Byssovorax sp.]
MPACTHQDLPPGIDDPVTRAQHAPKPISGGTMLVTSKGLAVAADPDRDLVWLVDLNSRAVKKVALEADDEPGRVVEDGAGRVHVALRGGGAVATIDLAKAKVVDRTEVCAAPRGLAFDKSADSIHVACATGELVTLPAAGGAATRTLHLERDLRDVMVQGDNLVVTRFKRAELITLDASGKIINRSAPPVLDPSHSFDKGGGDEFSGFQAFEPGVAWRTVPLAGHGFVMTHQRGLLSPVVISQPDGYGSSGGGCDGSIDHSTVTVFDENGTASTLPGPALSAAVLPVDIATDGDNVAVVAAGSDRVLTTTVNNVSQESSGDFVSCSTLHSEMSVPGEPIAVSFFQGQVIVQTREPAAIYMMANGATPIVLPGESMADTGHHLFHHAASSTTGLACASCHPEGHEDGRVWQFDIIGARRTQEVGNDVLQTAPLHWDGDLDNLDAIMSEVFVHRMGGTPQGERHVDAMAHWMSSMPRVKVAKPAATEASIEHGKALFESSAVACGSCHNGTHLTNNANADVGTGRSFQVPSLVGVGARAPFMHDGCAPTLKDRFTNKACGGGDQHGQTSQLSEADIDDLVAYLETL